MLRKAPAFDAGASYLATLEQARSSEALYEVDRAVDLYRRAVKLTPRLPVARAALGRLAQGRGEFDVAARHFSTVAALRSAASRGAWPEVEAAVDGRLTEWKVRHDLEQVEYLVEQGLLPSRHRSTLSGYREILSLFDTGVLDRTATFRLDPVFLERLGPLYNTALYRTPRWGGRRTLNPRLSFRALEERYLRARPQVLVVDDILTAEAWAALLRQCRESTLWWNIRGPGALASYAADGFATQLVYQIAEELSDRMPRLFRDLSLKDAWGYKYDAKRGGLEAHADPARINVNFWVTPESANLDPHSGGMVVYHLLAPQSWTFRDYNDTGSGKVRRLLAASARGSTHIAYRANRAVFFNGQLFHQTDRLHFAGGHQNRRLNITYLFGDPAHQPELWRALSWQNEARYLGEAP